MRVWRHTCDTAAVVEIRRQRLIREKNVCPEAKSGWPHLGRVYVKVCQRVCNSPGERELKRNYAGTRAHIHARATRTHVRDNKRGQWWCEPQMSGYVK